jgi:MoaA/NifB/PqqE/SkfB family radical SAM enzyme
MSNQWLPSIGSSLLTSSFTEHLPSVLLRAGIGLAERRQRPLIASINVVNRCNLHCAGCYWSRTERNEDREELSIEETVHLINELWKRGVRQFLLLGGEPMMERHKVEQLVQAIAKLGGISTIVTNGTYDLPAPGEWPRTHFFISCDGDRQGMDRVRGFDVVHQTNVFEKVKSVAFNRKDVMLAMTISKLNVERIEAFARETLTWGIGGIAFSFATPNVGERQSFYLSDERKEQAVQEILRLKQELGDFIAMSERAIELLRPSEVAKWSPKCPTFIAQSIRADGQPLERCIFGPQGDCDRCGCNIVTSAVALREGDRETARMVAYPARLAGIR